MRLQLLSDLHLETEDFDPQPAPQAELLVLAGDIDANHDALGRFAGWPVPVLFVAGNHEYDLRDFDQTTAQLRQRCRDLGLHMLERDTLVLRLGERQVRFVGTTLWNDFDLFGASKRESCMRAARYFIEQVQRSVRHGRQMDAHDLRAEGLRSRDWLREQLRQPRCLPGQWDATVVVTHFAPSLRSTDPRYPVNGATASFCNAYDDMIGHCNLWLHGHLHCRHDYRADDARVVCNARGHASKGEDEDFQPLGVWEI